MTRYDEIAQRYIDSWNETNPQARRTIVDVTYSDAARYTDPLAEAEGRDAIDAMIGAVQQQFPGFVFRLAGAVDGHHNQVRFSWELGPKATEAVIVGFDVAVLDDDGRIQSVLGFLDKVPAAA